MLVEPEHERLSIVRQCELLGMSRAAYYYEPWEWDETALAMLRAIDEEYTRHPFWASGGCAITLRNSATTWASNARGR